MFIYTITCLQLVLFIIMVHKVQPSIVVLDKGIFPIDKGSIGIQFFINVENNHHWKTCSIHSWPKMCCLEDRPYRDCCSDIVYGDNVQSIMARRRDTLIFIYPTLYHHDQVGQCDFIINFKCDRQKRYKQIDMSINFDTKMRNKKPPIYLQTFKNLKRSDCASLDEDTLNNCAPVDCDLKYAGRRPYYDVIRNKCDGAPACVTDLTKDMPDIVYVPKSNICRDLDQSIMIADIYAIGSGLGTVTEFTEYLPNEMKVELTSNCSTISENLKLLRDLITGNLCPMIKGNTSAYSNCCRNAILSICACIVAISAVLLSIICCIHITICMYKRSSKEEFKDVLNKLRTKIKKDNIIKTPSRVSKDVTNNLLKEVIVRDLPLELRESVVDLCDRISKEVRLKKRYRMMDLESRVNFNVSESETTSGSSSARSRGHNDND